MQNPVKDFLDMAAAEHQFLLTDGAPLAEAVPRLAAGRTKLGLLLKAAAQQVTAQSQGTAVITNTRDELKTATIKPAEVLRRWVLLATTPGPETREALKTLPVEKEGGPDKNYLDYLQLLLHEADLIPEVERKEMGYNDTVRTSLADQVAALVATAGATRQQQSKQKTATSLLTPAVTDVRLWLDNEIGPLVHGQALDPVLGPLVLRYDVLHTIKHTVGPRKHKVLTGHTHFGIPEIVIRRTQLTIPGGTLRNKSGKGIGLRYYLTDTPDTVPTDGRGRLVKYREVVAVPDLGTLGPNPNAAFLMVLQENQGAEGTYRLEYTPTGGKPK